jgi:hypothetical protein
MASARAFAWWGESAQINLSRYRFLSSFELVIGDEATGAISRAGARIDVYDWSRSRWPQRDRAARARM